MTRTLFEKFSVPAANVASRRSGLFSLRNPREMHQ